MSQAPFPREDVLALLCSAQATDPESLEWKPLLRLFKGTLRLRMNITKQNVSEELIDSWRQAKYTVDPPEVTGLLRVLEQACARAQIGYRVEKGSTEVLKGMVGFFEPYKIKLPFTSTTLSMTMPAQEFQWILKGGKETSNVAGLESLKREILAGTKDWIRRGNR